MLRKLFKNNSKEAIKQLTPKDNKNTPPKDIIKPLKEPNYVSWFDVMTWKPEPRPVVYKNTETFLALAPLANIPKGNRLVLDDYLFDVTELKENAERNHDIYRNPHTRKEFSNAAKKQIQEHPVLKSFAQALELKEVKQVEQITPKTVDAVIAMLNKYHAKGAEGALDANQEFQNYLINLPEAEQQALLNFVITVPYIDGGAKRVIFKENFEEGQCIIVAQIFGWQFVVTMRGEEALKLVPEAVQQSALQKGFIISAKLQKEVKQDNNNDMQLPPLSFPNGPMQFFRTPTTRLEDAETLINQIEDKMMMALLEGNVLKLKALSLLMNAIATGAFVIDIRPPANNGNSGNAERKSAIDESKSAEPPANNSPRLGRREIG